MFNDSVDSSRPPSEFDVPDSGHGDSIDALGSGQEENQGKVRNVRNGVRQVLLALSAIVVALSSGMNKAEAVEIKANDAELAALQEGFGNAASAKRDEARVLQSETRSLCLELDAIIGDDKAGWNDVDAETRNICNKLFN